MVLHLLQKLPGICFLAFFQRKLWSSEKTYMDSLRWFCLYESMHALPRTWWKTCVYVKGVSGFVATFLDSGLRRNYFFCLLYIPQPLSTWSMVDFFYLPTENETPFSVKTHSCFCRLYVLLQMTKCMYLCPNTTG